MARRRLVDGVETVALVFRNASRESQEGIAHALNLGGKEIVDRAKILVPVGDYAGAGDLRDSIRVSATPIRVVSRTGRDGGDRQSAAVYVVAGTDRGTAAYARVQEFGRAPSAGHRGHAAQPFMFPAYFSVRNRVRSRIKRAIKAAVKATRGG